MNIKEIFKKYGILVVVAVLFVGAISYFAYDSNKGKIAGKTSGGKDVVVSINRFDVTADDLYDGLMNGQYGGYGLYLFYERAVVAATVTPDKDMQSSAKLQAEQLIAQFKEEYGDSYKQTLQAALQGVGLKTESDLTTYFLHYLMLNKMTDEYITANLDSLLDPYIATMKPREVSHILVKMVDPKKPTAEESKKLADVKAALASGKDFADVAKEFSDDTSASQGGALGLIDKDTEFVEPFLKAALALNHGEVSAWVETEYGWHIIHNTLSNPEELKKNEKIMVAFKEENAEVTIKVMKQAAEKLDIKFADEKIQQKLETFMSVTK